MGLIDVLHDLKPTPSAYLKAARQIEAGKFEELRPVSVDILSTFTADLLRPYLIVESACRGLLARPYFAPFNQLEQPVLDGNSSLYQSMPDVVIIATRPEEIAPNLATRFVSLSRGDIDNELAGIEARLQGLIEGLRRFTNATILVFNYAGPTFLAAGLADTSLETSQSSAIQRANDRVAEICRKSPGVLVFDYARLTQEIGLQRLHDPKLWYLGRIPFGVETQLKAGRWLARYLRAICLPPCKCLAVDLDNTLWGGVLGEEGLGGIALGEDYPGNVYKEFQRRLLSLRDRGILLALNSKNNEADAIEVFQRHPDCVLKMDDFASVQINWQDKATNMAAIAEELNIGTDAIAFFDDNPVEREWVRTQMPEVTVIEVPESPLDFWRALEWSGAFDHLVIAAEDRQRAGMYQKEHERKQLQAQSVSLDEFLQQLNMVATIGSVNSETSETLPRVAQLVTKTNQFNLTTRRHTSSELETMIESGAAALWLRVTDRFGDNGLVGVAIVLPGESGQWLIDTFLLSCRVIGRQVETALLGTISRIIRQRGGKALLGEYIPTPRNTIAAEFYPAHRFEPLDSDRRLWKWDLSRGEIALPEFIEVRFEGDTKH
ncbi:HAD-IIIC family phosphatase [Chloroflexota bacterium]